MRLLSTTCAVAFFAVALLLNVGCCKPKDSAAAPQQVYEPRQEQVVAAAPAPVAPVAQEQASERAGIKVSMFPLSSPPAYTQPPPQMSYVAPPPQPIYATASAPAYCPSPTGVCQIVAPGSTIISDPPTVTLSATGEVVDQTGATYRTVNGPGTVYAAAPQTAVYSPAPQTTVYATTTASTAPEPITPGSSTLIPVTTTVQETRTVTYSSSTYSTPTYSSPVVQTTTYSSPAPLSSAVYYPVSTPIGTTGVVSPSTGGIYTPPAVGSFQLVPAPDIPPGNHPNDALPSQWFEILRPGNGPIRIGRVSATCVCVSPRVPNRFIGQGERALIEARIVSRPPSNNLTYGIFVNTVEPIAQTLDADITVRY